MKRVLELFMDENDKEALTLLYEITKDELVKIALSWQEYPIYEVWTNESFMYDDIIQLIWKKYKLDEI